MDITMVLSDSTGMLDWQWPLWEHITWTSTWSQVVTQTPGIHRGLSGNRSHRYQHRPPKLYQGHGLWRGPYQQPRLKHCNGPEWQARHLPQLIPHCPHLFRSASLPSTRIILHFSLFYFTILYSLTIKVPDCALSEAYG